MRISKLHQVGAGARDLNETVRLYRDTLGAGLTGRWMAFSKDPSGNTLALASQRMPR